jgi:glycosyltransferase involved in cell wall biosynthesis
MKQMADSRRAGARTRADAGASVPAIALDLSDLFHHIGRGPVTGITRVAIAYLEHCLTLERPVFGFVRHAGYALVLDRTAMALFAREMTGRRHWQRPGLRDRLRPGLLPEQRRALSALRNHALASSGLRSTSRLIRRFLPAGSVVLLIGLANIHRSAMAEFAANGLAPVVMIHDTIPLDFPQYVVKGGYGWFEERLRNVGARAALVLYNSAQTEQDAKAHFARLGRVPPGVVAHLGVPYLCPAPQELPAGFDRSSPYFVVLGTIEGRKNHALLLDLWENMARADAKPLPRLLIVGTRGWSNADFFRRLDASPLAGTVVKEMPGLSDGAVAALIAGARGLLFPSHAEGYGLPAIEAAALGTPVVANDLPVFREFLGDYAILIPVNEPGRWQRAIEALAQGGRQGKEPPPLPSWEAHFATVFAAIDALYSPEARQ